jgi:hypothetical protein
VQTLASSLLLGRPFGSQIAGYSLAAGDDSNELGGCRSDPGVRRPLHYAIDFSAQRGHREFKRNFPAVELLLEDGADPRLLDSMPSPCWPIEELESWLKSHAEGRCQAMEELEVHLFLLLHSVLWNPKQMSSTVSTT